MRRRENLKIRENEKVWVLSLKFKPLSLILSIHHILSYSYTLSLTDKQTTKQTDTHKHTQNPNPTQRLVEDKNAHAGMLTKKSS